MTQATNELMLDILQKLQDGQSQLQHSHRMTNERLSAIEHHLAGIAISVNRSTDEMDMVKARIDRIERRLEISNEPPTEPKA